MEALKFIVDVNVGKLAKKLRMMGYDALLIHDADDYDLVRISLKGERILLTRDTSIMQRRVVTTGGRKVLFIEDTEAPEQFRKLLQQVNLAEAAHPFTRCIECNQLLEAKTKDEIKELVSPYVLKAQENYRQCPDCHRVDWGGGRG